MQELVLKAEQERVQEKDRNTMQRTPWAIPSYSSSVCPVFKSYVITTPLTSREPCPVSVCTGELESSPRNHHKSIVGY